MTTTHDEVPGDTGARIGVEQVQLANERTFLAWVRTALALIATGLAIATFDVPLPEAWKTASAAAFVVLGTASAVQSWWGWRANDAAILAGEDLPAPGARLYLAAGTIVISLALVVGIVAA